jgi:hypothetical protein
MNIWWSRDNRCLLDPFVIIVINNNGLVEFLTPVARPPQTLITLLVFSSFIEIALVK